MALRALAFLIILNGSFALDTDNDGIIDDRDPCPFDRDNDGDSDNICSAEFCVDDPEFEIPFNGFKCSHFGPGEEGFGKCAQYQEDGIADVCSSCACTCAHEVACGFDFCPADAQNDADKDGICGDVDSCPLDEDNDADSDGICGNIDTCIDDAENDADSDDLCGDVDSCPYDAENDADNDLLCGNEDTCQFDALNDIDSDNLCGDVDICPTDKENDADGDNLCDVAQCLDTEDFVSAAGYTCAEYAAEKGYCKLDSTAELDVCSACGCACADEPACGGSVDICPYDADNDADNDNICGDVDPCPLDQENDSDNDNLCADEDLCPNDASNDVDSDNICGELDSCPMDPENDADGDQLCDVAQCVDSKEFVSASGYTCAEYALETGYCKVDSTDGLDVCTACSCACANEPECGFDICPDDPDNDADSDNLCANEDVCPDDPTNDVDLDNICGQVDSCPMDRENDADADGICGDQDECPYDAENDFDNDAICADADPCPYDFRPAVDGRCSEERLRFSQLDSLQALRETFPAAESDDCLWSDAINAAEFGLEFVQCMRADQVFQLHNAKQTLSGELTITAHAAWEQRHQEQLAQYIGSVARVVPSRISFSGTRDDDLLPLPDYRGQHNEAILNHGDGRRSLSHLYTVTIGVSIKIDHLPFRPLRCSDPGACNFNEDITELFISSNKTVTDCCTYSCTTTTQINGQFLDKSATQATSKVTSDIDSEAHSHDKSKAVDDEISNSDCKKHYLYLGIGIGVGGCLIVILLSILITYCVLKNMGYALEKFRIKEQQGNESLKSEYTDENVSVSVV